jgi:CMP/dCMP kinase
LKPPLSAEDLLRGFTIAIDGPSGSGKTTTAKLVARRLGFRHIDTGAMYRAVTLAAREQGIDVGDGERLGAMARGLAVEVTADGAGTAMVRIAGRDVTDAIRSPEVTAAVSAVSAHRPVRVAMVRRQRELAGAGGSILEGRDIGSVVLPGADVKIYLDASVRVRAQRRCDELRRAGMHEDVDNVERDLERRDSFDASREESPLVRPVGAWRVDTSQLTIDEQVDRVVTLAREEAARREASLARPVRVDRKRLGWRVTTGLVAWVYTILFGMRVRHYFRGEPAENYLFASNHRSYADPPVVGSRLSREVHFVAKDSLFKNPLFGRLIRFYNAFPIRRGVFDREAMQTALDLLNRGRSVLIFPEGGRVFGEDLGPGRSGVAYLAINSGVPVVPVYVSGTDRLRDCLFRRSRILVVHGRPIRIPPPLCAEYREADDRAAYRRYSDMVMAAIRALRDAADDAR